MKKEIDRHTSFYDAALAYDGQLGFPSPERISTDPDTRFYVEEALGTSGAVLELGCGTGRITFALADAGLTVVGLDSSEEMIRVAKAKLKPDSVLSVRFAHGDMREFSIDDRFSRIYIPFNAVHHLYSSTDIRRCLQSVRRHFSSDGRLVFDCLNPSVRFLANPRHNFVKTREYQDARTGGIVTISEKNIYDAESQILENEFLYDYGERACKYRVDKRIWFPQELDAHLHYNGFTVIAKYGDFDRSAFKSESPKQIVMCELA